MSNTMTPTPMPTTGIGVDQITMVENLTTGNWEIRALQHLPSGDTLPFGPIVVPPQCLAEAKRALPAAAAKLGADLQASAGVATDEICAGLWALANSWLAIPAEARQPQSVAGPSLLF